MVRLSLSNGFKRIRAAGASEKGLLLGLILSYLFVTYLFVARLPLNIDKPVIYTIAPGSSIRHVAQSLAADRIIPSPWFFELWLRWKGQPMQAGEYLLTPGMRLSKLAHRVAVGQVYLYRVSFPEGWTFGQLWRRLESNEALVHDISADQVMAVLGNPSLSPEGQFFPDTYYFPRNTPVSHLLIRAHLLLENQLMEAWMSRSSEDPMVLTPQALLTLASLIQKESAHLDELPAISGVLYKRLQRKMRLQVDPTVIYALGAAYTGTLSKSDLKHHSPYNTYVVTGLPPTPIGLVSKAALQAAAQPNIGTAVYYVSRGDGTHTFSNTLEEHHMATQFYQAQRRNTEE